VHVHIFLGALRGYAEWSDIAVRHDGINQSFVWLPAVAPRLFGMVWMPQDHV
jgi:hypothetical protein